MRDSAPFRADDLEALDEFYGRAEAVLPMWPFVPMRSQEGKSPGALGLRHDVDDNVGSLDTAMRFAEWEHERGYRSTYYLLHDSHYWPRARAAASYFEHLGHEVGLHVNGIAEALRQDRPVWDIIEEALVHLRWGAGISGVVAHGDSLCHVHGFVNDEIWTECPRPDYGDPERTIAGRVAIEPRSLREFGLRYDANWLPRAAYLSDSGGRWSTPFDEFADAFPYAGNAHLLVHPDWWGQAFGSALVTV